MPRYVVHFGRIGRTKYTSPIFVEAKTITELEEIIATYARSHLGSSDVAVIAAIGGTGFINVGGFRNGGDFTWQEIS